MICILSLPLFAASNGSPNAIRVNWLKKYNPDKLSIISFHNFIYMEDITCDKEDIIPASLDYIIAINGKKTDSIATEDIYPILNGAMAGWNCSCTPSLTMSIMNWDMLP